MELFSIGPLELLLIILLAIIVFGPKDIAKTGGEIGAWLNKFTRSELWQSLRKTSDDLRNLPARLMREDNFKQYLETKKDSSPQAADQDTLDAWTRRPSVSMDPAAGRADENRILAEAPASKPRPAQKKPAAPRKKTPSSKKKTTVPAAKRAPKKKSDE